ncbi:MAG: hypothetical protein AABZ10_07205 [Nitrospirota bacterium]
MKATDFTEISARYERDSLIQKSAAEKLIGLLGIRRNDNVLDLGCGTGSLTRKLKWKKQRKEAMDMKMVLARRMGDSMKAGTK